MSDRIAFTYLDSTRDGSAYLIDEQVTVVDAKEKKDAFRMSLNLQRKSFPMRFGLPAFKLILSPNGKRLAVMRDNSIHYFVVN